MDSQSIRDSISIDEQEVDIGNKCSESSSSDCRNEATDRNTFDRRRRMPNQTWTASLSKFELMVLDTLLHYIIVRKSFNFIIMADSK